MTLKRAFWLAVLVGTIIEASCCGLYTMFGQVGPCGPGNALTGLLFMLHGPGFAVAEMFPESSGIQLPMIVVVTGALWSVAAFLVIAVARSFPAGDTQQE